MGYYTKIASIIEAKTHYTGLINSGNFMPFAGCMACIDNKIAQFPRIFLINDAWGGVSISKNR
jgi:hypothetical protein